MGKDIVLAKSPEEAARSRSLWTIPPEGSVKLWWAVRNRAKEFPLLHSICAHEEGPEGDFHVPPDQVQSLVKEIELIQSDQDVQVDPDFRGLLERLRDIALEAQRTKLTIHGFAD